MLDMSNSENLHTPMVKKLPTISIKGKDYVLVKDRIIAFNEMYPNGSIITRIIRDDENSVVVTASACPDVANGDRIFIGHSEAYREGSMGNVPVEVAETSAVGRALGMMGIGVIEGIASADEMVKAQKPMAKATDAQIKLLKNLFPQKGKNTPNDDWFNNISAWKASKAIEELMKMETVTMGDEDTNIEGEKSDYNPVTGELLP